MLIACILCLCVCIWTYSQSSSRDVMRMWKHVDLRYRRKGSRISSEIHHSRNLSDTHSDNGCFFEISLGPGQVLKQPHQGNSLQNALGSSCWIKRAYSLTIYHDIHVLSDTFTCTDLPAEDGFQQRMENWEGERNGTWLTYELFYLFALHLDK